MVRGRQGSPQEKTEVTRLYITRKDAEACIQVSEMRYKIHLSDPYISDEDVKAVAKALKEKRLSQGEYVQRFEEEFAEYIGVKHAVAVCNGTAALHVALAAIDVGPTDEVIVPSFSFVATANCVLYQRAKPVFADINPSTCNIDPNEIERKITNKTKAIIPVHYAGQSADMDPINEIAERHGVYIIEDAAEAHGTLYKGRKAGTLGDIACFSFYPNKNMTTCEGGMITTNDDGLAEKMRMIRSHGQEERYHHVILGYNYRMSDLHAALGRIQLKRLDWVIRKKVERANYYDRRIRKMSTDNVHPPYVASYSTHVYMFYSVRFENKELRDKAIVELEKNGIETRISFPCIHLQPLYQRLFGYKKGFLPVTERISETILSLPMFPHISREEQEYVLSVLNNIL
jgi:perosamine synthetase